MDIVLSPDQKTCLDAMLTWWDDGYSSLLTLGGYAGTGKTTLISVLRDRLPNVRIAFCAYTGKAASVLSTKLKSSRIMRADDYCGTVHALIYVPVLDKEKKIIGWEIKKDYTPPYDLIILDEASMINEELFYDLEGFGIPILAVGDHGQLPPIGGNLNLMKKPDLTLDKIHRQAENDPIIKLSLLARMEGYIPYGVYGKSVVKVRAKDKLISQFINHSGDFSETAILCGFNKTRVKVNQRIRSHLNRIDGFPVKDERVLCLRNNKQAQDCPIFNGAQGTVEAVTDVGSHLEMSINIDGERNKYYGPVAYTAFDQASPELDHKRIKRTKVVRRGSEETFEIVHEVPDFFDFGYCLSVHKSQGSEWRRVMLIEQPCRYWAGEDWNRWLYTGVTRAIEQLLVVR